MAKVWHSVTLLVNVLLLAISSALLALTLTGRKPLDDPREKMVRIVLFAIAVGWALSSLARFFID